MSRDRSKLQQGAEPQTGFLVLVSFFFNDARPPAVTSLFSDQTLMQMEFKSSFNGSNVRL